MCRLTGPVLAVAIMTLLSGLTIGCAASQSTPGGPSPDLVSVPAAAPSPPLPSPTAQSQQPAASATATAAAGVPTASDPDEFPHGALWILESINGSPLHSDSYITITVDRDSLYGYDDCNSFASQPGNGDLVARSDGTFSLPTEIFRTDMGCPRSELELLQDAFWEELRRVEGFRIATDQLELFDESKESTLVFIKQRELPGDPIDLEGLKGTHWRLVLEGDWTDAGPAGTLAFLNERWAAGTTACREFVAFHMTLAEAVRFPYISRLGPEDGCSEAQGGFEELFISSLDSSDYAVTGTGDARRLRIRGPRGRILTFEPLPREIGSVTDVTWLLTAFVDDFPDGSISSVHAIETTDRLVESEVSMSLERDHISGSAGCNSYTANSTLGDSSISIGPLATSRKSCPEPAGVMEQETRYLDLLQGLKWFWIYGDRLFMSTDDGRSAVFAAAQ